MSEKEFVFSEDELLKPDNMIKLYARGAFPMYNHLINCIEWYLPDTRAVIKLDSYNIPRSLKKSIEKSGFEFKYDTDFLSVVNACADRETTWINQKLINAYLRLKKRGHVHTVETWLNGKLVGGLYGISFRGAFFGESMFSSVPQASKAALVKLLERIKEKDFLLVDVQYITDHLRMFGAKEISRDEYILLLNEAYERNCEF